MPGPTRCCPPGPDQPTSPAGSGRWDPAPPAHQWDTAATTGRGANQWDPAPGAQRPADPDRTANQWDSVPGSVRGASGPPQSAGDNDQWHGVPCRRSAGHSGRAHAVARAFQPTRRPSDPQQQPPSGSRPTAPDGGHAGSGHPGVTGTPPPWPGTQTPGPSRAGTAPTPPSATWPDREPPRQPGGGHEPRHHTPGHATDRSAAQRRHRRRRSSDRRAPTAGPAAASRPAKSGQVGTAVATCRAGRPGQARRERFGVPGAGPAAGRTVLVRRESARSGRRAGTQSPERGPGQSDWSGEGPTALIPKVATSRPAAAGGRSRPGRLRRRTAIPALRPSRAARGHGPSGQLHLGSAGPPGGTRPADAPGQAPAPGQPRAGPSADPAATALIPAPPPGRALRRSWTRPPDGCRTSAAQERGTVGRCRPARRGTEAAAWRPGGATTPPPDG